MSHNIVLKDVKYTDLSQLAQIVASVSNGQCVLDKDAKRFRTWPGQPDQCDAVIKMPGKYDIGLQKQGNAYVPIADFSMMGVTPLRGGFHPMGKVQQEYALREAEYTAAQQGMTSSRIQQKDGTVTLELVKAQ
jgi:hypothetical protein